MINNRKKELIAQTVIKILVSRFSSFPNETNNNRNAPFHEAFLNAFSDKLNGRVQDIPDYISLSSWLHGLNTSLGQSFFESTAHILCDGEKRDFTNNQIYSNQISAIAEIMTDLKNGQNQPSVEREFETIRRNANGEMRTAPKFTVDCFYETDNEVVAIELKSVRPNSGEMRGEKQKILYGKATLQHIFPTKEVRYFFGFPFDPTATEDVAYDKTRFLHYLVEAEKFCDKEEILISDELWSFLSGNSNGTMREILDIINQIATPSFMDNYNKIQESTIDNINDCRNIFETWCLFSEIEILNNMGILNANNSKKRILNQRVFRTDGAYNENRKQLL